MLALRPTLGHVCEVEGNIFIVGLKLSIDDQQSSCWWPRGRSEVEETG